LRIISLFWCILDDKIFDLISNRLMIAMIIVVSTPLYIGIFGIFGIFGWVDRMWSRCSGSSVWALKNWKFDKLEN
jgi:hypothetical protein